MRNLAGTIAGLVWISPQIHKCPATIFQTLGKIHRIVNKPLTKHPRIQGVASQTRSTVDEHKSLAV
jgi:hypothetical protein